MARQHTFRSAVVMVRMLMRSSRMKRSIQNLLFVLASFSKIILCVTYPSQAQTE